MKKESETEEHGKEEGKQTGPTEEAVEEVEEAEETREIEEQLEEATEEKVEAEEELPAVEEEAKPSRRKEVEEEIVEERIYTIPLGKAWIATPKKRAPRAMRVIRDFVNRHMKLEVHRGAGIEEEEEEEPKRLVISNEVNERIWRRGIQKPPRKVRVRAAKDKDGNVTVYLAEGD